MVTVWFFFIMNVATPQFVDNFASYGDCERFRKQTQVYLDAFGANGKTTFCEFREKLQCKF